MTSMAWCPKLPDDDKSVKKACDTVNSLPGSPRSVYAAAGGGLNQMTAEDTLYIIAHGHKALPVFTVGANKYSPSQLANLIVLAGLQKTHRQIVMLVCHAGQSVGTKSEVENRWALNAAARNPLGDKAARDQAVKHSLAANNQSRPGLFNSEEQILPMICQFISELKKRKFNNIRVRGFLGKVDADFRLRKGIEVENPNTGVYERASSSNTVDWL